MLYVPPALQDAWHDLGLRRMDRDVLGLLWCELDVQTYRTVKAWVIARQLGMHRTAATRSLKRLAELGYIEPGKRLPRGIYTYRLVAKRPSAHYEPAA